MLHGEVLVLGRRTLILGSRLNTVTIVVCHGHCLHVLG